MTQSPNQSVSFPKTADVLLVLIYFIITSTQKTLPLIIDYYTHVIFIFQGIIRKQGI